MSIMFTKTMHLMQHKKFMFDIVCFTILDKRATLIINTFYLIVSNTHPVLLSYYYNRPPCSVYQQQGWPGLVQTYTPLDSSLMPNLDLLEITQTFHWIQIIAKLYI